MSPSSTPTATPCLLHSTSRTLPPALHTLCTAPTTRHQPPRTTHPPAPLQVMEGAFKGVGSHHFSTEGAGGDDMFPYVSFTLNIE